MIRVMADVGSIFIDGRAAAVPGGTLQAALSGSTITIANIHGGDPIVSTDFSQIADGSGNGFATPAQAMAYLGEAFEPPKPPALAVAQSQPSTSWSIAHGLAFYPNVTVIDTAGDQVLGDVSFPDINTVLIGFSQPTTGTAYLS